MRSGTLFVVATPIGNLEDITLRALRVLRDAQLIAAEDTRRTARLLTHHAISTPTLSFHAHNTRTRMPQILQRLEAGNHVALVTDAGTPGVSDPGVELVHACVERRIPIDPIPGPSAPLVAGIASGFPLDPFTILGFPPVRGKHRTDWFRTASALTHTFSFFEAPHRIRHTLEDGAQYFGDRPIVVGRELTKVHQEFIRASNVGDIVGQIPDRGEFTVIVGPLAAAAGIAEPSSDAEVLSDFWQIAERPGVSRRQALAGVAKRHGRSSREVYALVEKAKQSAK